MADRIDAKYRGVLVQVSTESLAALLNLPAGSRIHRVTIDGTKLSDVMNVIVDGGVDSDLPPAGENGELVRVHLTVRRGEDGAQVEWPYRGVPVAERLH